MIFFENVVATVPLNLIGRVSLYSTEGEFEMLGLAFKTNCSTKLGCKIFGLNS